MTIKEIIKNTNKNIYITIGYVWKNPTTLKKLVSKDEAIRNIEWGAISKIDEETEDSIYLHVYSYLDMD